jgi:diadenosine tetraphosphate (Ap4A) HIT family hydrolase
MIMEFGDRIEYLKRNPFIEKDNCFFCNPEWKDAEYIIWETKYWTIRHNKYPYFWNSRNLLASPKKHKKFTYELSKVELSDMKEVDCFMRKFYKWENYFSLIRETLWWRTAEHLHYHYLPWIIFQEMKNEKTYLRIKN